MDFNAIIKRVIAIITKPKDEWEVIKNEQMSVADMYTKYAVILAAIPAVFGFIGWVAIGKSFMGFTVRVPVGRALMWAIFTYIFSLAATYILAMIIDALAPSFGAQKDMIRSLKVSIYSYTAAWVAGVFYLIPALGILVMIAAIYTWYLLFTGMKSLKEAPAEKMTGYFVVTIIAAVVIFFIIGFLVATISFGSGASRFMF